ncbi:MAG TPA: glycosyltransferase family 1 protein, partial [Deltaproteobacteria bacterium]|nr:glycosyltransferase family 1 protein [Deltaproteobacteria bacterium]
ADPCYRSQLEIAAVDQPITLRPEVEALRGELARAHLVLYPTSLPEGFPDVAVEAMAVGRAVVWPDVAPLAEALGGSGIAVAGADVDSVRGAIVAAGSGLDLARLGREAHAVAQRRHSWQVLWPRWRSLLVSTAGR